MTDLSKSAADAADGKPVNWQAALSEHDRWLRTVVLARVGERQAVDDVMQEVALAAVAQRAPLRDNEKVAPWLYRLAVRQSLMYRRKMGRRRKLTDRYVDQRQPRNTTSPGDDPLTWLLADERQRLIRTAMRRLPRRDTELLLLKYTEGWSYQQIAQHLGITPSAVEARLHRARQKMRDELTALAVIEAKP